VGQCGGILSGAVDRPEKGKPDARAPGKIDAARKQRQSRNKPKSEDQRVCVLEGLKAGPLASNQDAEHLATHPDGGFAQVDHTTHHGLAGDGAHLHGGGQQTGARNGFDFRLLQRAHGIPSRFAQGLGGGWKMNSWPGEVNV
jgi:hypothetical protein